MSYKNPHRNLGKNEPCWCGSKKKFKHCHFGQDRQKCLQPYDAANALQNSRSEPKCYASGLFTTPCSGKIIGAHTVSRASNLTAIADNHHVYGHELRPHELFKNSGRSKLKKIGTRKASVFYGFCEEHDRKLFANFETQEFVGSPEQTASIAFRNVCKELNAKDNVVQSMKMLSAGIPGQSAVEQIETELTAKSLLTGTHSARLELVEIQEQLAKSIGSSNYSAVSSCILWFDAQLPLAISSCYSPQSDFEGNALQDLGDLSRKASSMYFDVAKSSPKTALVFTWIKCPEDILSKFMESLLSKGENVAAWVFELFLRVSENVFIAPKWFDSLKRDQKDWVSQVAATNPFDALDEIKVIEPPQWLSDRLPKLERTEFI